MSATSERSEQALDARRLKALGHPVRLGIALRLAVEPETCACDFAEVFGVRQPTVSQHLRVLREAGLVTTQRRGTQICYSLDPAALAGLAQLVARLSGGDETFPTRDRRHAS
jgi:ArsR family transcriptional regulator